MKRLIMAKTVAAAVAYAASGQTTPLRFEVVSVKVRTEPTRSSSTGPMPGGERFRATNATLKMLVRTAFHVRPDQVVNGPAWIEREFYDVDAKAERPSTEEEMRAMLRNLLIDRFALRIRRETRDLPVYVLSVDRDGPRLAKTAVQPGGDPVVDQSMEPWPSHRLKMKARAWPMSFLIERLGAFLDRPVIDRTDLAGNYDFELTFVEDVPEQVVENLAKQGKQFDPHLTIFEAVRKQLGLRLEPQKGPVETIIVEHAERPVPN
jgi:uncharacterized protein (TIGR03435 family)